MAGQVATSVAELLRPMIDLPVQDAALSAWFRGRCQPLASRRLRSSGMLPAAAEVPAVRLGH